MPRVAAVLACLLLGTALLWWFTADPRRDVRSTAGDTPSETSLPGDQPVAATDLRDVVPVSASNPATTDASNAGQQVHGRVIDTDGIVRSGVRVLVGDAAWAETAADGTFTVAKRLPTGVWPVRVMDERLVSPKQVRVADADVQLEIVVLRHADLPRIRGVVVDTAGDPVAGANVETWGSMAAGACRADVDGRFVLRCTSDGEPEGTRFAVEKVGFEKLRTDQIVTWGSDGVRLVLRRGVAVTLSVTDARTGDPVTGFGVRWVARPGAWGLLADYTGFDAGIEHRGEHADGQLQFAGLARGQHLVMVVPTGGGYGPSPFHRVELGREPTVRVDVALSPLARRTLRVVRRDATPVIGTRVELVETLGGEPVTMRTRVRAERRLRGVPADFADQAFLHQKGTTDERGELQLRGSARARLTLRLLGPGHRPTVVAVVLGSATEPLIARVEAGATILGTIRPAEFVTRVFAKSTGEVMLPFVRLVRGTGERREVFPMPGGARCSLGRDGSLELTGVPLGDWDLEVVWCHSKRLRGERELRLQSVLGLQEGERRRVDIDAGPFVLARITGRVLVNGEPYFGTVYLRREERSLRIETQKDGRFETWELPGRYRLGVMRGRRGSFVNQFAAEHLVVTPGQDVRQDFHVTSHVTRLRITGHDGQPRRNARLLLLTVGSKQVQYAPFADKDGDTEIELAPGTYRLAVMPHVLTTTKGIAAFEKKYQGAADAWRKEIVELKKITVPAGGLQTLVELVLPAATGY